MMKKIYFYSSICLLIFTHCSRSEYWNQNFILQPLIKEANKEANFSLSKLVDNQEQNIKYIILNFFAPDCPPCIEELPFLKKLYASLPKYPHIKFLMIGSLLEDLNAENIDLKYTKTKLLEFQKIENLNIPMYITSKQNFKDFKITGFPETIILTKRDNKWHLKRKFISVVHEENLFPVLNLPYENK